MSTMHGVCSFKKRTATETSSRRRLSYTTSPQTDTHSAHCPQKDTRSPDKDKYDLEEAVKKIQEHGRRCCTQHVKNLLARAAAEGTLEAVEGGLSLVLVIDAENCKTKPAKEKLNNTVVFCCSKCNYVGDRLYHAQMHFERIHMREGKPIIRKRKYSSPQQILGSNRNAKKQQQGYLEDKIMEGAKFAYFGDLFQGAANFRQEIHDKLFPASSDRTAKPFMQQDFSSFKHQGLCSNKHEEQECHEDFFFEAQPQEAEDEDEAYNIYNNMRMLEDSDSTCTYSSQDSSSSSYKLLL